MKYKYSPSLKAFFVLGMPGIALPDDATVDVSEEQHRELFAAQSAGKCIVPGTDGFPVAADRPAVPAAAILAGRRRQILAELQRIDASGARASRAIALALIARTEPADADVATIENLESQAIDLRADLAALEIAQ